MRTLHHIRHLTTAAAVVLLAPVALNAQMAASEVPSRSTTMSALLRDLDQVEEKFIGLGEAIPESDFDWRPGEGVRSVSEVMMHVAADNYFMPIAAGTAAPAETGIKAGDYRSVQAYEQQPATKAEAIAAARASFAHLRAAMQGVDDAALAGNIEIFGTSMSSTDLWVMTVTHLHEHLGQMIAYARSNGVVPPWSR